MNETAHTQTPWEIGSDPYTILTKSRGIIGQTTNYWVDTESAKANAEFIVKACNEHKALDAAYGLLEELWGVSIDTLIEHDEKAYDDVKGRLDTIRQTLAAGLL